ncbi:unnamed protein product [Musa hybrid cultivar]
MAIRYFHPNAILPRDQTRKTMVRASLIYNSQISPQTSVSLSNFFRINHKVYEDQVRGIICYRDERGEIICEGYDEGSRHSHHLSSENGKRICEGYNERPRYHLRSPAQVEETVCEAYDDQVKGIICCRDKTGEMICEGIDEGPRYSYRSSSQNTYEARCRRKHISSRINSNHMSH